jgi:hypothetical protein
MRESVADSAKLTPASIMACNTQNWTFLRPLATLSSTDRGDPVSASFGRRSRWALQGSRSRSVITIVPSWCQPTRAEAGRIAVLVRCWIRTRVTPSTCVNWPHVHDLHHFRGHVRDPAPDHRKGRHRARRAVITAGHGADAGPAERAERESRAAGCLPVITRWFPPVPNAMLDPC